LKRRKVGVIYLLLLASEYITIELLVIGSPDIGKNTETATLVAEDRDSDIACLRIEKPRSTRCVALEDGLAPSGTNMGSLGFLLATIQHT